MTEYKIKLGLTHKEMSDVLNKGETPIFHFLPTDDTEYNEKISISISQVEDDALLGECMDLKVKEQNE
jgi:hypothetical protein